MLAAPILLPAEIVGRCRGGSTTQPWAKRWLIVCWRFQSFRRLSGDDVADQLVPALEGLIRAAYMLSISKSSSASGWNSS